MTETVDEWAARLAASLPPMTPEAIASVARIANRIDKRRAQAKEEAARGVRGVG